MIALIAVSVGATYAITSSVISEFDSPGSVAGAFMTGHIDAIVYDESGSIISYRQSDNEIVVGGMDVLADQLFLRCDYTSGGPGSCIVGPGTNNHTNSTGGAFGYMNIGNQSVPAPSGTDTGLNCPLLNAGSGDPEYTCPAGGISRGACVGVFDEVWNSEPVLKNGASQINVTVISTFDGADCESRDIREAAMWNNATSPATAPEGQMFARNTFGSVTLTNTDSLELTWRFTFTDQ